jgi:hypothetical protein
MEMYGARQLAGGFLLGVEQACSISRDNATGLFLTTLFPVDDYNAVLIPLGDGLIGANVGTHRLGTVITRRGHVTDKDFGELSFFPIKEPHPPGRPGWHIMPVLAGNGTGEAAGTATLVKIKTQLHRYIPPQALVVSTSTVFRAAAPPGE